MTNLTTSCFVSTSADNSTAGVYKAIEGTGGAVEPHLVKDEGCSTHS
jgi:hypothetical protein